jgi:hypothetical protein
MIDAFLDALGTEQIDPVDNDSGSALSARPKAAR